MHYLAIALTLLLCSSGGQAATRNFDAITQSGVLRLLTWSGAETYLPRNDSPLHQERQLIADFAQSQGVKLDIVAIERYEDLIPALLAGQGDLIVSNMTITRQRGRAVRFTAPVASTHEYLIQSKKSTLIKSAETLNTKTLHVQSGTSYWQTAQGLKKVYPGLTVRAIETGMTTDMIMDKVAAGEFDVTIVDGNSFHVINGYRNDVARSLQASGKRHLGWAVHPANTSLLKQLNAFITHHAMGQLPAPVKPANQWERIKTKKTIRIALRNNMASYFIWRGELYGFNYELAKDFASKQGLRYQIIVAPDNEAMLQYLVEDKADIALGFFTPNQRREKMGLGFSRPYHYASEVVVSRSQDNTVNSLADLAGRTLYARSSSSYWYTLEKIKKNLPAINLQAVDERLETEAIIDRVASNQYDLTVADSHMLDLEMTWRDDVKGSFSLGEPKGQSWVVNNKNTMLLNEVNRYIKKSYRGLFYNVNYNKYFKNTSRINKIQKYHSDLTENGKLSPYDTMVKKYARQYGYDWRLLVSQMYQESKFDPKVKSWSGAQGLFQVMPRTAKELGFDDVVNPENGIHAGAKYLQWVQRRMEYAKPEPDQLIWFTLASYNAGAGHVRDAIRLAQEKGWRGDRWFGHVEKAMLLLSKPEYAARARHGYVRGHEPVNYVQNIRKRFEAYQHVTD